ncbi:MAG: capsule biosynthesis protein [Moraxella sp.]|nr:capsule biosynthesis protein [Moraxella sp.]
MSTTAKNKRKRIGIALFIGVVLVPWFLTIGYMLAIAKPRYVSESGVVVKQVSEQTASVGGITALLGVNNTSREDALYLMQYILSDDMINTLDSQFNFRKNYYINGADFIGEIDPNATQEELREYFKKRVSVELDEQSLILNVQTQGFTPEYALELNQAILAESERFVNQISNQVAKDQLAFAEGQVITSEDKLNETKTLLLAYQNENEVFDPQTNAQIITQVIGGLQSQLSSLRTEERQLLSYLNSDAPQVVSLRSQINSVEKQIRDEQSKLTSGNDKKLNAQTAEFETLKADVEFATELYKLSLSALEKSRLEVIRKMKNLIVISSPHKAEEALYPRRAYVIFTALALLLILYGFISLILAVVRDHSK